MCCIKWRKTYNKTVSNSPGQLEYLGQVTYSKGIWVEVSVETGQDTSQLGGGATWTIPIRQDLDTNGSWKIVRPDSEAPIGRLQLEVKVANDVARFRLVNLSDTITLKWINVTFEVNGQDNPTIQELTGVGQSNTVDFYLPDDSSAEPWIALIKVEADARIAQDSQLAGQLQTEINTRQATVDAETQGRIAAMATANALIATNTTAIAQEILDRIAGDTFGLARANHTGTQLAATISDFDSATRAQVEAELTAGSGITITPSGSGATRILTLASSGGGTSSDESKIFPLDVLPASPTTQDDPFSGTTLDAKWSAIGGAGLTTTVKNGWLVMEVTATGAAFNLRGIEQVLPAGNFSILLPLIQLGFGQYSIAGLHVRNATSGAILRATCFNNSNSIADVWWGAARYS